jgi:hypothetical protein
MQQYLPVNWVDGMKMNKSHFIAERNAQLQTLANTASSFVNDVNYGLLPQAAAEHKPFRLFVAADNQDMVSVKLISCRAITPGGCIVHIDETEQFGSASLTAAPVLQVPIQELKEKQGAHLVVLHINPYNQVATGNTMVDELPPRLPYTAPLLQLSVVHAAELEGKKPGMFQLSLGKITMDGNRMQLVDDYIPPCSAVASHPELVDIFYGLDEFMSKMELYSLQIIQKINQKRQANELAAMAQQICQGLLYYQSSSFSFFKWSALHMPPFVMFSQVAAQARLVKNILDTFLNSGKEELLNYFTEWCDLNQGELETVITELGNHQYSHEDINEAVIKTQGYTKVISSLFYKLSRLDYIGKKREAGIFVKEEIVQTQKPDFVQKKRRSFLADE